MNIFRLIYHDFKSYKMISILIVLNVIISAFVICFSYGIYQNYNVKIEDGESVQRQLKVVPTLKDNIAESSVTTKMVIDTVKSLSNDTLKNIDSFFCEALVSTSAIEKNDFIFSFSYVDGKFHGIGYNNSFDDDQYNSYKKIVAINPVLRERNGSVGFTLEGIGDWNSKYIGDAENVEINGESYKIINESYNGGILDSPITAFYNNTFVMGGSFCLEINFKTDISRSQYDDIVSAVAANMGDNAEVPEMDISPTTELFYYRTILMISVLISVLASINFAVLYRYVLQKRIKTLTIFRICGCTKMKIIFIYLFECMIVGLPLFALTMLCFDKLALPALSGAFEYIEFAYSPLLYLAIFGIYAVSSFVVLLIMIGTYISRRSIIELKAGEL